MKSNIKTDFIADIGSNHNLDWGRTRNLITAAKDIGCKGVKFQLFKAEKLWHPENKGTIETMKQWELPPKFIFKIANECAKMELDFICTPFDSGSAEVLEEYVDAFKIGSYEFGYNNLIAYCADTSVPFIIISTGMTTLKEVGDLLEQEYLCGVDITLLHCCSIYPANPEDCNLSVIKHMKEIFQCPVGWSDHTVSSGVIHRAVGFGADIIEFHLDLEDKKGNEYPIGHCWLPNEIERVIAEVKEGEKAIGDGIKYPTIEEQRLRKLRTDPNDGMRPIKEVRKK